MNRVIVAFESDDASRRVCDMLSASGRMIRAVCKTGAEVIRTIRYMDGGVVICGTKLTDMTADQLYEAIEGQARILVMAKAERLAMCENPRLFRLTLPANRFDLAASVRMLEQLLEMDQPPVRHGEEEREQIRRAKAWLALSRGMDEQTAHRYLQKTSMAQHKKISDVAAELLDKGRTE